MRNQGYKKYMKKEAQKENPFLKIFIISFFGMLLVFTFIIKSISKYTAVDTSIGGDYQAEMEIDEPKKIVDDRLSMIQNEDQGRNFSDLMSKAEDVQVTKEQAADDSKHVAEEVKQPAQDPVYKVFVGSYTSAEQAKVAKDIIQESGNGLNPIVKCIGANNYTLQVGIFKNKQSAESLLYTVQQNNLPGRIVQDY